MAAEEIVGSIFSPFNDVTGTLLKVRVVRSDYIPRLGIAPITKRVETNPSGLGLSFMLFTAFVGSSSEYISGQLS